MDTLKKAQKEGLPEDAEKDAEDKLQKLHDKYIKKADELFAEKEKEIMTVWYAYARTCNQKYRKQLPG